MNKLIKFSIIFLLSGLVFSCEKDSPMLTVAKEQLNYNYEDIGGTQFATVKSDQKFTATSDQIWCTPEIYAGGRNNNLRITTDKNENAEIRTAIITIASTGLSDIQITVVQNAATPYISVTEKTIILGKVTEFTLEITANILFTYELPAWIQPKADNIPVTGKGTYTFIAQPLTSGERLGDIIIKAVNIVKMVSPVTIPVTQTNNILPLIDEHFDWATSASTDIFTSTNEVRLEAWPIQGKVWTSSTPGVFDVWTRSGYLKFCRGNTGADLVSPTLTGITGLQDVIVTFKACGYLTSAVKDKYHEFNISVIGGGTPSITHFSIDNYPDSQAHEHGAGWLWQNDPAAQYTFTVTGATSATQIVFMAGPKLGILDGNSRLGLDDVKVELK